MLGREQGEGGGCLRSSPYVSLYHDNVLLSQLSYSLTPLNVSYLHGSQNVFGGPLTRRF